MGDRKHAVDFYNQAVSAVNDQGNPQRLEFAYQLFSSAVLTDPTWVDAQYQAGNNNNDVKRYFSAIAHWRQALNCEADKTMRGKILCNMAWRLLHEGQVEEALACALQSISLDDTLDATYVNLSCIYRVMDCPLASLEAAQRAFALAPGNAMNEFALAMSLLFERRWQEGFKHLESRFAYRLKNFTQYPYPKWSGEEGMTLYLVADQGLGDTLSFARFLPQVAKRCAAVHACVQPELLHLFQNSFGDLGNVDFSSNSNRMMPADCWSTFVSLPLALGLSDREIEDCPSVPVDHYDMPVNWRIPDRKLHIGVAWAGSPANDIDAYRSIPVETFFELYRVPGVQLYSLQKSDRTRDLYDKGGMALVYDLAPMITTVADTAAFLRKLDLVICCESALAHICVAAGTECWVAYSYLGRDYRMGCTGEQQLWSKHRIFRQGQDLQWGPVFRQIVEALREKVDDVAHADRRAATRILERAGA